MQERCQVPTSFSVSPHVCYVRLAYGSLLRRIAARLAYACGVQIWSISGLSTGFESHQVLHVCKPSTTLIYVSDQWNAALGATQIRSKNAKMTKFDPHRRTPGWEGYDVTDSHRRAGRNKLVVKLKRGVASTSKQHYNITSMLSKHS